jgi:choline monooxygenase
MQPLDELLSDYDPARALDDAWTIPGSWYTDPRIADLERRRVHAHTWQMVGRTAQVERAGDYLTAEVAGEPIVVVRGADGVLRAFFNVCRHHAAAVMTRPAGHAQCLQCPYHGWTYNLCGELESQTEFKGVRGFDKKDHGLAPLAVDTWEKFVFVHVDPDPRPLRDFLGDLVGRFQPLRLDHLHFVARREWEIECNWKVFVDNYLDGGYHVPFLHKGLNSILDYKAYSIENGPSYCLQSSPIDTAGGEAMTAAVRHGQALYYWIYPNLMLNWYEGYLDTNLVLPLSPTRMKVVFEFYFSDVSESAAERNRQSMDVSERIQDEDHAICESVQRGLASRAYRAGRLSVRREAGEHLFHRLLARDLRS